MKAGETIRFRCTKEQRDSFESQAKASRLTLSAWIISKCAPESHVATKDKSIKNVATKPFVCLLKNK